MRDVTRPGWDIRTEENSAGVYHLQARYRSGYTLDVKGMEPEKLMTAVDEVTAEFSEKETDSLRE